jgi:hypothetical protein
MARLERVRQLCVCAGASIHVGARMPEASWRCFVCFAARMVICHEGMAVRASTACRHGLLGSMGARKNYESHIDASLSRQPLVKGEILVRYEVNAVMVVHGASSRARAHTCVRRHLPRAPYRKRASTRDPTMPSVGRTGCARAREGSHSDCRAQNHFILQMCDSNFVPCHIIIMALVQSFIVASVPRESL